MVSKAEERYLVRTETREQCARLLAEFRREVPGVLTAGVVAPDGFEIAVWASDRISIRKISALTSTLIGVAHAFAREAGMNACRNVIVETEGGKAIFMDVGSEEPRNAFFVVVEDDSTLGRTLSQARQCAGALGKILAKT